MCTEIRGKAGARSPRRQFIQGENVSKENLAHDALAEEQFIFGLRRLKFVDQFNKFFRHRPMPLLLERER